MSIKSVSVSLADINIRPFFERSSIPLVIFIEFRPSETAASSVLTTPIHENGSLLLFNRLSLKVPSSISQWRRVGSKDLPS